MGIAFIALTMTGCFGLFSGGSSRQTVSATDTIAAYEEHLARNPSAPDVEKHKRRLAELELIELQKHLKPVFGDTANFTDAPNRQPSGQFTPHTHLVFDSAKDGWFGVKATKLEANTRLDSLNFFQRDGKLVPIEVIKKKRGKTNFSVNKLAGIPLVKTSSFDASIKQWSDYGGGMTFCFFSPTDENCDEGYEFHYDTAQFKEYRLSSKSMTGNTVLCSYKMTTSNHQHSTSITVDLAQNKKRDPEITISAHNGHINVYFNGYNICSVNDTSHVGGHFLLDDAVGMHEFSIDMNAGSEPFFVSQSDLADIRHGDSPLASQDGSLYEINNRFVADYNTFISAMNGGSAPDKEFNNSYFNEFLGKGEADEAYAAVKAQNSIDAYRAYLMEYPVNSHKKEIHAAIFTLAENENTVEAYKKFADQYPKSKLRLEIKKRIADIEWKTLVKTGTESELNAYLSKHSDGYYKQKAELTLKSLAYHRENKEEVDRKKSIIRAAQKAVNKSPITMAWDVTIIDYVDGNIFYNINSGPTSGDNVHFKLLEVGVAQADAYENTCNLIRRKVRGIETCMDAWHRDIATPRYSIPLTYAIMKAMDKFYLPAVFKGADLYTSQFLYLLDQLVTVETIGRVNDSEAKDPLIYAANVFSRLGMDDLAVYALYKYVVKSDKRKSLGKNVEYQFLQGNYQSLEDNDDFKWVIELGGGGYSEEKREQLRK